MASAVAEIHEDLFPAFQQQSLDLITSTLRESRALRDQEGQRDRVHRKWELEEQSRRLKEKMKELEAEQEELEITRRQQQQVGGVVFPNHHVAGTSSADCNGLNRCLDS